MSGAQRVTIAGAGVFGLTIALALADAGCAVTICDPGGLNASAVAAGMIAPVFEAVLDDSARAHLGLLMHARDLWPALAKRAAIELDRSGALAVGRDDWLDRIAAGVMSLGLRTAEVSGETARQLTPGLSLTVERALLTREDWRVNAPAALAALRRAAEASGVAMRRVAIADRGDADVLVVATGAGDDLASAAPELARLSPIKGQIARLDAKGAAGLVVRADGFYAVPGGGQLTVGATMEPGVSDVRVEPARLEPLLRGAAELFPDLAGAPVAMSAGVRAATPDGLPMVGPSVSPGVLLAVGARRNGWLLAPLVAQAVTACVMHRERGTHAARLDPARFQGLR